MHAARHKIIRIGDIFKRGTGPWLVVLAVALLNWATWAQSGSRVPATSLKLPATPPVYGFGTTNAFENLIFNYPVGISAPPGETNRLFVLEKTGRLLVITNLVSPTTSVFLDLTQTYYTDEGGLLSLAFHPGFATNGFFYLYYTLKTNTAAGTGVHDRISRFSVSATNPNQSRPESELPLLTQWRQEGSEHHGGDMHFGPDGYLYVSLGDESGSDDSLKLAQVIEKDFFAGILRLDVDKRPGNLPPNPHPAATTNYSIPADNPFVGATSFNGLPVDPTQVRTEFWAKGLRNPWRMCFNPATGDLYCADVGQASREEINLIVKGGNYGWPIREGTIEGPQATSSPLGGQHFRSIDPILEYVHGVDSLQASAVIGGVVYHGRRFSELADNYIFGDHVNGNIWAFRWDGAKVNNWRLLTAEPGISAFGIDPSNGDILIAMYYLKTIKRLIHRSSPSGSPLPPTLADTGAFRDLRTLEPNPGIVPYDINVSFWSDHAVKQRWFCIPDTNRVINLSSNGWQFPAGTVWVKHFDLERTNGISASRQRIETRFLVQNTSRAFYGLTYSWDDSQTNATLVPNEGLDKVFLIQDGGMARTQTWHYPGRSECLICHNTVGGPVLGFRPEQLNLAQDGGVGKPVNQIQALAAQGYFSPDLVAANYTGVALAAATNEAVSLEFRVRSYLAANCSQCHQPGGLGQNSFDARIHTPTSSSGLINGLLLSASQASGQRVLVPGDPARSEILARISTLGNERMPPLASNELDAGAIRLLTDWITTDLSGYEGYAQWQLRFFGSTNSPQAQAAADPDQDGAPNALEYLTQTDPTDAKSVWRIHGQRVQDQLQISFEHLGNRAFQVQTASEPTDPSSWHALSTTAGSMVYPSTSYPEVISDTISPGSPSKFYRVQVIAP